MRKLTQKEFEDRCKIKHCGEYDYSETIYIKSQEKVCVICKEHGKFYITPNAHLNGQGCPKCAIDKRSEIRRDDKHSFIQKSIGVHRDKYDYSEVEYNSSCEKVCIICPTHGHFMQTPNHHLQGHGCPKCKSKVKLNRVEYIKKAVKIHNGKYDYSKVVYNNNKTRVIIRCPIHGEYSQTPNGHLLGKGCPKCNGGVGYDIEYFCLKANQVHKGFYDYDSVEYVNTNTKVKIKCPYHGLFEQRPYSHLQGHGCPKCVKNNKMDDNAFIQKAQDVHGVRYDYSKSKYINIDTKLDIYCSRHGLFRQKPRYHLSGSGCPKCKRSKLENDISLFLQQNGINYIEQYRPIWLGLQSLDFYLPDYNVGIECQGKQHFMSGNNFGGTETLEILQNRDKIKLKKCQENGVKLLYYSNLGIEYPYDVFEDKEDLLNAIKGSIINKKNE